MKPYYDKAGITIYCGDCREIIPTLGGDFDLSIADPPYFKIADAEWDKVWQTLTEYIAWLEGAIIKIKAALSPKGSLYVFGDDKTIAYVQVMIDQYLTLLNSIVWHKTNNISVKTVMNLRSYAVMTERILFYTPQLCPTGHDRVHLDINNFRPLRNYFKEYQDAIGLSIKEINRTLGHRKAEHAFYWNSTQWELPTQEVYAELGQAFNGNLIRRGYEDLKREYEFLRREYEDLKREYEDLRRTFNASQDTFDVIAGPIINQNENTDHPTTKPLWLMTRLILASSNPGDRILDPFMGSGPVIEAAQREGRRAVGIELNEDYCKIAVERLKQPSFFSIPDKQPKPEILNGEQLPLWQN